MYRCPRRQQHPPITHLHVNHFQEDLLSNCGILRVGHCGVGSPRSPVTKIANYGRERWQSFGCERTEPSTTIADGSRCKLKSVFLITRTSWDGFEYPVWVSEDQLACTTYERCLTRLMRGSRKSSYQTYPWTAMMMDDDKSRLHSKNHFGTSGPQTARLSCPAAPHPTGVSRFTRSPSA